MFIEQVVNILEKAWFGILDLVVYIVYGHDQIPVGCM